MDSATSPVCSSGDDDGDALGQSQAGVHMPAEGDAQTPVLNIRETISVANDASSASASGQALSDRDDDDSGGHPAPGTMSSRAYQLEMLDQSLRQNVIVAMDTGSGKTQVAVLRIKAELETSPPGKIIWLLAPTVSLCVQQFQVIQLQTTSTPMKLLTGSDNVDTWSGAIWATILGSVRIVISTHQVLLDALSHAFIAMDRLALIVFDEAHNCIGKHPGSKIMTDFYHRQRSLGSSVPSILGLSATPSMKSSRVDLETLEAVLDSKCISPTAHREELLSHVKKPQLSHVTYSSPSTVEHTPSMRALHNAYLAMDITCDPYVLRLKNHLTDRNRRTLATVFEKYDTYSQNQMRGLLSRAVVICQELGPWAVNLYLWKTITTYLDRVGSESGYFDSWINEEKLYLSELLRQVGPPRPAGRPQGPYDISDKARVLLHELLAADDSVIGIIFVKERATVTMLCELLSSSPRVLEKYRIGSMVGTSSYSGKRRAVYEFLGETDLQALQNFRSGKINLLVASAVLEEGIDVPACNLVVCFDSPSTPKAFIQRRGRARTRDSRLILLSERSSGILDHWNSLEREMAEIYQDEEREIQRLELLEESEYTGSMFFEVSATGARLDFDNAKQHLEHFCRTLSQGEFVDSRPDYIVHRHLNNDQQALSCTVLLPSFVPVELRRADSTATWLSEKNATKDAAFQAYVGLYKAGLINDNLLPFKFDEIPGVELRAPEVEVESPLKPWQQAALAWRETGDKWLYTVSCYSNGNRLVGEYEILLPVRVDQPLPIQTYLSDDQNCEIRLGPGRPIKHAALFRYPDHTSTLLALHFAHRWPVEDRAHVIRVMVPNETLSMDLIGCTGFDSADDRVKSGQYLVRDPSRTPFIYEGLLPSKPPAEMVKMMFADYDKAPANVPYLALSKWTRRADFLHHIHQDPSKESMSAKPYSRTLPLPWATVDAIPAKHAHFGMLIPSIIHEIEVMLVAKELATTLIHEVGITDLALVREAISSRSASEPMDYERLEFLGDSILKYCASIQASVENPNWPEGYLSFFKDRVVSNSRLSRASIEKGMAKFILTKPFTGHKWRPLYVDDVIRNESSPSPSRKLSTKMLADVVEALIGASYQDGGISKALKCIAFFIHDHEWRDISVNQARLNGLAQDNETLPAVLLPLEELIGYSFQKKSLLIESITHASYIADSGKRSFERLEFLGDAILDNIVVTKLFSMKPPLKHHQMHMLKTASVNGDFLAFITMEHVLRQSEPTVTPDLEVVTQEKSVRLWNFMRHASISIGLEHESTMKRHQELRRDILDTMEHGTQYPWALLARMQAKKFYSDLFEAVLGAVWVDSGSIEACEALVARFGITSYLDRLVRDKVNVQHPKEELGKWAVAETVTYALEVHEGSDGEKSYGCKVLVGERTVAEVNGGVTREEVKTKAAEVAVKFLAREKATSMHS